LFHTVIGRFFEESALTLLSRCVRVPLEHVILPLFSPFLPILGQNVTKT
jgi:hypothetical protein